jgi:hypothetical protein
MIPWAVGFSIRVYDRLLGCYPPRHRQRFRGEMHQVFAQFICEQYKEKGVPGILRLWLPLLVDWVWTVTYQWIRNLKNERRYAMSTALDRQLSDMVWSVTTGLRAGYDLRQVFEVISKAAPEPAALTAQIFLDEIAKGTDVKTALACMKRAFPSPFLDRLISAILELQQTGLNLADLVDLQREALFEECRDDPSYFEPQRKLADALEPLIDELLDECGSDPAFYEFMRGAARQLGTRVPERANPRV